MHHFYAKIKLIFILTATHYKQKMGPVERNKTNSTTKLDRETGRAIHQAKKLKTCARAPVFIADARV